MKIKREVNGRVLEYELTEHELWQAYDELEHRFDIETVDFYCGDEVPDDRMDEVANKYRNLYGKYIEQDNDVRYECVCDAIREVLGYED